MKVKCISVEGYLFTPKEVREGYKQRTTFNRLKIDREYLVYGIIYYQEGLRYLIYDDLDLATWYPTELFEVTENKVPETWYYQFEGYQEEGITAIWGYDELVHSEKHFDGLSEQENEDILLFLKRKREMYS